MGRGLPNAACVVSLVDRLVHHAEIITIQGASYRLKEAKERTEQRQSAPATKRPNPVTPRPTTPPENSHDHPADPR